MMKKNDEHDAYCVATVLINQLHTLLDTKPEDNHWTLSQLVNRRDTLVKDGIIKKSTNKGDLARPYIDSNGATLLVDEIMKGRTPVKDEVLNNGLRWDVNGTFRGSIGTWELVIDTNSNTIMHFNFVAK